MAAVTPDGDVPCPDIKRLGGVSGSFQKVTKSEDTERVAPLLDSLREINECVQTRLRLQGKFPKQLSVMGCISQRNDLIEAFWSALGKSRISG